MIRIASRSRMETGVIVTGTDGSASAAEAVRQAAALAASSGAELHVVSAYRREEEGPGESVLGVLEAARDALAAVDVPVHLHAEPGGPAEALCAVAARVGGELIV